ncbi:MAG TPA: hypothetical protein VL966_11140 [Alphaproteobacteria bacterium]|jgi:hypothetical protein|nr:hypothetical protein [Alphaproteobacteria bacterium]
MEAKEQSKALPGEPTMAEAELRVLARGDGTWLLFTTSKGRHARVKMEQIADSVGGANGEVIREWCDDQHARTEL